MLEEITTEVQMSSNLDDITSFSKSRIWKDIESILEEAKEKNIRELRIPGKSTEEADYLCAVLDMLDDFLEWPETLLELKKQQLEEIKDGD